MSVVSNRMFTTMYICIVSFLGVQSQPIFLSRDLHVLAQDKIPSFLLANVLLFQGYRLTADFLFHSTYDHRPDVFTMATGQASDQPEAAIDLIRSVYLT